MASVLYMNYNRKESSYKIVDIATFGVCGMHAVLMVYKQFLMDKEIIRYS